MRLQWSVGLTLKFQTEKEGSLHTIEAMEINIPTAMHIRICNVADAVMARLLEREMRDLERRGLMPAAGPQRRPQNELLNPERYGL